MIKKRKCGTSLIELLCVMSIMLIIFSCTIEHVNIYEKMICDIKQKSLIYEVDNLINYGKEYCSSNNAKGYIMMHNDKDKRSLSFECKGECKYKYELDKDVYFYLAKSETKVYLTLEKDSTKGCSIEFYFPKTKKRLVMTVGVYNTKTKSYLVDT